MAHVQDMWTLSGIFRDVYILVQPTSLHITDYHVRTPLGFDADHNLNSVALDVTVNLSAMVRTCIFRLPAGRTCEHTSEAMWNVLQRCTNSATRRNVSLYSR